MQLLGQQRLKIAQLFTLLGIIEFISFLKLLKTQSEIVSWFECLVFCEAELVSFAQTFAHVSALRVSSASGTRVLKR